MHQSLRLKISTTRTWFWRPVVWVVVSLQGWTFLLTKEASWREVSTVGLGVRFLIGGWSNRWGMPVLWGPCVLTK